MSDHSEPIRLDGSQGEGGGQILRTALALAAVTGRGVQLENIRARRKNPGLARQHLCAVQAVAQVCRAQVRGAELRSQWLEFIPDRPAAGEYRFDIGTAGSTTLVLQTVLPPLLMAQGASLVEISGGTHNPMAPPFEFLKETFAPALARTVGRLELELLRPGFYPAGGGRIRARIEPTAPGPGIQWTEPVRPRVVLAQVLLARLPRHIAARELAVLRRELKLEEGQQEILARDDAGPGNAVLVHVQAGPVREVFAGFGQRGKPAPRVAAEVVRQVQRFLQAGVPVGPHLADQLLLPLALLGRGAFLTVRPTPHTRTNADVIRRFLPVEFAFREHASRRWLVQVARRGESSQP